VSSRSRDKFIT